MKDPNREEDMSDEDFVFAVLGKHISPLIITFIPDDFFYSTLVFYSMSMNIAVMYTT